MKCDVEGNVYCTGPGGIYVHDASGKVLARMKTPGHHPTNIAWGDDDWRSLYITMIGSVVRTRLNDRRRAVAVERTHMAWNFELVAGRTRGAPAVWRGTARRMLFSAVQEERILRFDPATGKAEDFRKYTGRTNGLAVAADGTVFGAQEGGRRVVHFLKDGSTAPTHDLLDGKTSQPADRRHRGQQGACVVRRRVQRARRRTARRSTRFSTTRRCCGSSAAGRRAWKLSASRTTRWGRAAVLLSADEKTLYVADGDAERGNRASCAPIR